MDLFIIKFLEVLLNKGSFSIHKSELIQFEFYKFNYEKLRIMIESCMEQIKQTRILLARNI